MDKTLVGLLLILVSMICYGIGNPILKKAGFNPFATIIIQIAILWLVVLPFFIISKSYHEIFTNKQNIFLLVIAGITNAIGYYLLVKSFQYLPIWQINLAWVLVPLFGAIAAFFLLGESLTLKFFIGLIFTLIGLFIAFR